MLFFLGRISKVINNKSDWCNTIGCLSSIIYISIIQRMILSAIRELNYDQLDDAISSLQYISLLNPLFKKIGPIFTKSKQIYLAKAFNQLGLDTHFLAPISNQCTCLYTCLLHFILLTIGYSILNIKFSINFFLNRENTETYLPISRNDEQFYLLVLIASTIFIFKFKIICYATSYIVKHFFKK